jgi:GNAT superfamily N-acetyltransferase
MRHRMYCLATATLRVTFLAATKRTAVDEASLPSRRTGWLTHARAEFAAVSIPGGHDYKFRGMDCDVDSMIVPCTSGHFWFWVYTCAERRLVAWAVFGAGSQFVQCCEIMVDEAFRQKGVATALYRRAACLFEAPVVPTTMLSDICDVLERPIFDHM